MKDLFDIQGKVFIVTGGAGLLGVQHAVAIAGKNGIPVLLDINASKLEIATDQLKKKLNVQACGIQCDITSESEIENKYQLIDGAHRLAIAEFLQYEKVPVKIIKPSSFEIPNYTDYIDIKEPEYKAKLI